MNANSYYFQFDDDLAIDYGENLYLLHNGWTALEEDDNYRMRVSGLQDFAFDFYETGEWVTKVIYDESDGRFEFQTEITSFGATVNGTTNTNGLVVNGLESVKIILEDPDELTDGDYTGVVYVATAGETLAVDNWVYRKSTDGKLYKADNDGTDTYPVVGVIVSGGVTDAEVKFVNNGYYKNDGWSYTAGQFIYMGDTAGGDTDTAPSTSQDMIQILGQMTDDTDVIQIMIQTPFWMRVQ
jgi:hypothetical protein